MVIMAIEGANGAGKTWLCEHLKKKFTSDVEFLKTPFYDGVLGDCAKQALKPDTPFSRYRDEIMYGNWLAGCRTLKENGIYIIDRWYDSARIYSASSDWGSKQDWSFIPVPNVTVVVMPDKDLVLKRLKRRGPENQRVFDTAKSYDVVHDYFKNLCGEKFQTSYSSQFFIGERQFVFLTSEKDAQYFVDNVEEQFKFLAFQKMLVMEEFFNVI